MASTGKAIFLDKTATEKLILQSQEENRVILTELLNDKAKFIKEETIEEGKKLFALKDEVVAGGIETVVLPDGFYESVESNNGKLTNEQLSYFSFDEYKIYLMKLPIEAYVIDVYLAPSVKIDDVSEGKMLVLINDGFGFQVSINFNEKTFNIEVRGSYDDSDLRKRIEEAEYNIAGLSDYVYNLSHFRIEVVNNVSQVTETNVFYLIKDSNATGSDVYEEWILVNGTPTLIGDTSIDLNNYVSIDYAKENLVEMVEIPQSLVIKLLTAYNNGGDSFELTDNELAIFENYENKKYVAISPENSAISVVFTPSLRGLMGEDSLILYSGEFFMVQISFNTKTGRAGRTINSQDYDYLQRRVTEAEENIEKKVDQTYIEEQLGNIDEVLDEINGSGTTSGGGSSSSGSLTWEEIIFNIDKNVWTQNSEENYVCTDANTITEFNNILITLYEKKYIMSEVWLNMAGSGQEPLYVILNCHGGLSYLGTSSQKAPYAINFTSSHEGKTMCFAMYLSLDENNLIGSSQMSDLLSVSSAVFKIYYID